MHPGGGDSESGYGDTQTRVDPYSGGEAGPPANGPSVVPVPTRSPMAFVGPAIGIVAFVAILVGPIAFGVVMAIAAALVSLDISRVLASRAVAAPKLLTAIVAGLLPIVALRDLEAAALAVSAAAIVVCIWGLANIGTAGLGDSLAGTVTAVAIAGFGLAHGSLLATGEFRGGPGAATALVIITLLLIASNQIAGSVFAAATVQVASARSGSGDLWGFLATIFIAIVASTIRNPPVNRLYFLVLGIGVAGACTAGRAITTMLLYSPTDPEEIVDHSVAGGAFALKGLGVSAIALPVAYYIARWLFV